MTTTAGSRPSAPHQLVQEDPYVLTSDAIETPPATMFAALRRVGPGMVLAASIVGSGELIATTTLGAQVGFAALWIILVSCAIKPVVQGELGRYTIATGHTGLEGFNRMPGPRLGVSWLVWAWAITVLLTMLQVGGMYGGVAQVLHLLVPAVSINAWVAICLAITITVLVGGGYTRIEKLALVKVGFFSLLTVCAAAVLVIRPGAITASDLAAGLSFHLPAAGLATAIAVFGITGVGATELVQYPYWCVEKGYAKCVGQRDGSASWVARARGWIRVMHFDILCSLVIYTLATIAFYLLGAGILNRSGLVPAQRDMIQVLSRLYTQSLGEWALWLFYLGAVITLYGTIFASTAAHSRLFADAVRVAGLYAQRRRRGATPLADEVPDRVVADPAGLVTGSSSRRCRWSLIGGIAQAAMLPLIGIAAIYLRHKHVPKDIQPTAPTTVMLWIATAVMAGFALYYAAAQLR